MKNQRDIQDTSKPNEGTKLAAEEAKLSCCSALYGFFSDLMKPSVTRSETMSDEQFIRVAGMM